MPLLQVIYHYQIVLKYQKFRTRHRAAVGISEVSDAFTVVVSEETGDISVTFDGKLRRDISKDVFEELLAEHWFGAHFQKKGVNS